MKNKIILDQTSGYSIPSKMQKVISKTKYPSSTSSEDQIFKEDDKKYYKTKQVKIERIVYKLH